MRLTHPKNRHVKFKVNEAIKNQYPLTEKTSIHYEAGTEENYKRFGLRWTVAFVNKTDVEAITQITESRSIFELEDPQKDLSDLKIFIQNSFSSIQTNFQDKLPITLKHLVIAIPNFDEIAEKLMAEILKVK